MHGSALITGWELPSTGTSALVLSVLVANIPQPILSFLYLLFNGLCTSMLLADEWGGYRLNRKPLRVSEPRGQQRSTYFLHVPYRYGIPLVTMSGVLHWGISQSLFLAIIKVVDIHGETEEQSGVTTCGYSPAAIIFTLIIACLLLITVVAFGTRKLDPDMPPGSSCSFGIATACHSQGGNENDGEEATLPLQWGEVPLEDSDGNSDGAVGHCCFSSGPVSAPVEGKLYAGVAKKGDKID